MGHTKLRVTLPPRVDRVPAAHALLLLHTQLCTEMFFFFFLIFSVSSILRTEHTQAVSKRSGSGPVPSSRQQQGRL